MSTQFITENNLKIKKNGTMTKASIQEYNFKLAKHNHKWFFLFTKYSNHPVSKTHKVHVSKKEIISWFNLEKKLENKEKGERWTLRICGPWLEHHLLLSFLFFLFLVFFKGNIFFRLVLRWHLHLWNKHAKQWNTNLPRIKPWY